MKCSVAPVVLVEPKLGVLDECTSAVSIDVEERLYQTAKTTGIATITLSQVSR